VLGPFVYVFLILAMEVSHGVVSYGADKGVGVGRATAEKVIGQKLNEVTDKCDV
jgi:hypothetical protein